VWRYVGVTIDGVKFTILREVALEIRCVDNDVGQMTCRPSGGLMKRKMMSTTRARTA
jgi:hypothetical protein